MEMEENQAQLCEASGDTAPDAGEQEDFEALIRGRYKEEFDAKVRKILDGRLRGMRQENQRLKEQKEKLEGVRKAEAAERIDRLRRQEGELRRLYPDFDWQREMQSERFGRLILAGVEPRTWATGCRGGRTAGRHPVVPVAGSWSRRGRTVHGSPHFVRELPSREQVPEAGPCVLHVVRLARPLLQCIPVCP